MTNTVRSTEEIRASLMRRAFEGISTRSVEEMEALIARHEAAAALMPAEHAEALARLDYSEPRTVLMLNRLAIEEAKEKKRETGITFAPRKWTGKEPGL